MARKQTKQKGLFDFTSKILSTSRSQLIAPFPKHIHQLLASYIQLCFFTCLVPYRLVYNKNSFQYETKTNIFQRVLYTLLWTLSLIHHFGELTNHIFGRKPGNPIEILLLLGGVGHLLDFIIYLVCTTYYRDDIKDLLNFFILYGSYSRPSGNVVPTDSFENKKHYLRMPNTGSANPDIGIGTTISFKQIGQFWWLLTLAAGIKCTDIIDKIFAGTPLVELEKSDFYKLINGTLYPNLQEMLQSSSLFSQLVYVLLNIIVVSAYMQKFCGVFIYGLEVVVAFTIKSIASHFTKSLEVTKDYWKPSSSNILSSFIIVRQSYRLMNKIFGWLLFYSIMGEFPNFTFNLVFAYTSPNAPMQWPLKFGLVYAILLLSVSSWAVCELSKLKEWMHYEEKRHWSLTNGGSLQRRIILFELSLNRYALYAHGFFQLSLPAFVAIVAGILSNALIIIQMSMSNSGSSG